MIMNRIQPRIWIAIFTLHTGIAHGFQEQPFAKNPSVRGAPEIIHFGLDDFQSDPMMMAMCEDSSGVKYFGNQDGLLIFDGETWARLELPNKSLVKSLYYGSDHKVYLGGFNEFGTVERDKFGQYQYSSMVDMAKVDHLNLDFVYDIHEVQGHIIFRSMSKLIAIKGQKALTIPTSGFYSSAVVDDRLYMANWEDGIKEFDLHTMNFDLLIPKPLYQWNPIVSITAGNSAETLSIFTRDGQIYSYHLDSKHFLLVSNLFDKASTNQVTGAVRAEDGDYYIGTLANQLIMLTANGKTIPLNKPIIGLQDESVNNLYESKNGNLWVLLENGIDCINLSSPVSTVFNKASVFDVQLFQGIWYIATNQGVWASVQGLTGGPFKHMQFEPIAGLDGQAWSLTSIENQLLCGHEKGLFVIKGKDIKQIPASDGVWKVIPIQEKPGHYLVCTYYAPYLMSINSTGDFQIDNVISGFSESSRDILQSEPGVFWVCHGFKGVFRIKINPDYQSVVSVEHFEEAGLPSPYKVNVFSWKGEPVFTTSKGLYSFNDSLDVFQPHSLLNDILDPNIETRKIMETKDRTWYIHNDEVGYFNHEDNPVLQSEAFLQTRGTFNKHMESITLLDNGVLIGTKKGLFAFDLSSRTGSPVPHSVRISQLSYQNGNSRILLPLDNPLEILASQTQNLRFEYTVPQMDMLNDVRYSYQLSGADQVWSDWEDKPWKEYNSLDPGTYEFSVRAKSKLGESFLTAQQTLIVRPPWHQTTLAFVCYFILGLALIFLCVKVISKLLEEQRQRAILEAEKQNKILRLELDRMQLAQEKNQFESTKTSLEEDLLLKSKELANYATLLSRKQELMIELREELTDLENNTRNEKTRQDLKSLIRKIKTRLNDDDYIKVFEANFERVHHEFFSELKERYPDLTSKELRLCALVKMNLTNKEIAPIMNISIRGIETARYRLRKRLSIHDDMVEFLEKLSP